MMLSSRFLSKLSLCLIAALVVATPALSESVSLNPVKDASLFSNNSNLGNGFGSFMFVGQTRSFGVRRALVQFDITGSIPPGSVITSVTFLARVNRSRPTTSQIRLHRLLAEWGEGLTDASSPEGQGAPAQAGDTTWSHRFIPTDLWTIPGGDFSPTVSGMRNVTGNAQWNWNSTAQMVADVQSWLDDPVNNFGWIMIGTESGSRNAKRMATRHATNMSNLPILNIDFVPGCVYGNVNENGVGGIEDVLTINASVGANAERRVCANTGETLQIDLAAASGGPAMGVEYAIWVWQGDVRSILDLNVSGDLLGCTVNPTPFDAGMMLQPFVCIHSTGVDPSFCGTASIRNSPNSAPFTINRMGFRSPKTFMMQGILQDATATNPQGFSVTNAIILDVK